MSEGVQTTLYLPAREGNPRNGEGGFVELGDGRILLVYSRFKGGGDHAEACLAARISNDRGMTWSREDTLFLANEGGMNVMSASPLRLMDGRLGLFYLRKDSLKECRPCVRFSDDDGRTLSDAVECIPDDEIGYYVMNNDRVVQLPSGRLVAPVALHDRPRWKERDDHGTVICRLSDDGGRTWRGGQDRLTATDEAGERITTQEPGVVPLADGRVMLFCRTNVGRQYAAYSQDDCETWSPLGPTPLRSPKSPASIKRIPGTEDLLCLWNDNFDPEARSSGARTPLVAAVSRDGGETWTNRRTLEDDPNGWYCYTAVQFVDDYALLAYYAGDTSPGGAGGLSHMKVSRMPVSWFQEGAQPMPFASAS